MWSRIFATDELEDEAFEGLSQLDRSLERRVFTDCSFRDCAFAQATLDRCLFDSCVFSDCDMSMMSPYDTSFRDVRFERCRLMGIDWTKAHQLGFDVEFRECILSYCRFDAMKLIELSMTNCKVVEAVFTDADLSGADLSGTTLTGSVFLHTTLKRADLSLAHGYTIDPTVNKLGDTRFSLDGALRSMALLGVRVPTVDPAGS